MLFAGQEIPKSPFEVDVDKALGDASKVTAKGPGIEPVGNVANKPTYFEIYTAGQSNSYGTKVRDALKCQTTTVKTHITVKQRYCSVLLQSEKQEKQQVC